MMCIVEIACLVFGIIILAKGKVSLSANKEVRGGPAYIIGLLLLAVFPIALVIGIVVGIQKAKQGGPMQFDLSLVLIDLGVVVGCAAPALIIALATAKPKRRKRRGIAKKKITTTTTIGTTTTMMFGRASVGTNLKTTRTKRQPPRGRHRDDDYDRPRRDDY